MTWIPCRSDPLHRYHRGRIRQKTRGDCFRVERGIDRMTRMGDRTKLELHGQHVVLRPLRVDDAELTLGWRQSDRATLLNRGAASVADQAAWIASRPKTELNFVIQLRSGRPVGMLSLVNIDEVNGRAEPARFLIGDPDSVKGLPVALEALKLLYELVFDQLELHRVYGTVVADNRLMVKWHKSLGMKEEGRLRQHYFIAGRFHDGICIGMMEDEYRTVALPRMNALIGAAAAGTQIVSRSQGTS
jgi:RimJ/RimL family protein N-acetyltransferase